jgi:crotonobetaine/carnitine-CoA ligase
MHDALARLADSAPERVAVQDAGGDAVTAGDLLDRASAWAGALAAHGIGPADRVVTMVPNSVDALALWLGISWLRAIEVPVNTALRGEVLAHIVGTATPAVAVASGEFVTTLATACERAGHGILMVGPCGVAGGGTAVVPAEEFLGAGSAWPRLLPPRSSDTACVLFTSGTTGPSKGVVVPWGNLRASGLRSLPAEDLDGTDVWYGPGSASHVGAKSLPFMFAMLAGKTVLRDRFSIGEFWADVRRFGVTSTVMVSAMAHFLLQQPSGPQDADTTLRNVLMVPVIAELAEFNARFGTRTCTVFNMTEISVPIASGWIESPSQSCGRLLGGDPGYELRIVDRFDRAVPPGVAGEAVVRTCEPWTLNGGYFGMPQATADAWRNGWFHTGDILRMEPDGQFYFVDRVKDAIRVRGENVSSFEVESDVLAHPAVAECAAVAVPGGYGDDDVKVFVVRHPGGLLTAQELLSFLRPRTARHMLPRYVEFLDELPKNWRLRVRKDVLRALPRNREWDRYAARADETVQK